MAMLDTLTVGEALADAVDETASKLGEAELRTALAAAEMQREFLEENLADLELAFEDRGWSRVDTMGRNELSRATLGNASTLARTMALANPLIRRGLNLRIAYVWGQGLTINAKANGTIEGQQDVNAVVQKFLDDADVRKVLTSAGARERNERALGTDGNVFVALFTAPRFGTVQPRVVPFAEVQQVINNPDDRTDVWFYRRDVMAANGETKHTYHPDVDHRPVVRPKRLAPGSDGTAGALGLPDGTITEAGDVEWDAPMMHLKVNDLPEWDFGVGDTFAALAWAKAYKEFLEDWAKLVKALSRFAFRLSGGSRSATQLAAARLRQRPSTDVTNPRTAEALGENPRPVGQTWAGTQALESIPKTGATIDSESGRPIAAMVAAALDVPVTMLLADPGTTGNRATAETLDKPTENMAAMRRDVWGDFLRRLLDYVIDQAVKAPQGALRGTVSRDEWGREQTVLAGDTPRTLVLDWPDLTDTPIDVLVKAIATADDTETLPPLLVVQLLLAALGVRDADEWVDKVTDTDGTFLPPVDKVGSDATRRFRQGGDPAATLT